MNPLLALAAVVIHAVHTALGLPALEGIEQVILSPGPNVQYLWLKRSR
jgi:hypothetical protein